MIDEVRLALRGHAELPEIVTIGPVQERSWSWQFDLDSAVGPLLLKIPRPAGATSFAEAATPSERTITKAEFAALEEFARQTAERDDVAAVQPVAYIDALNGIVLERFDGVPLRAVARGFRRWDGPEMAGRVGAAVAAFHALHPVTRTRFDVEAERRALRDEVAAVDRPGRRLRRAAAELSGALEGLGDVLEPVGVVHGDLTLDNVLIDLEGRPALIDPNPAPGPLLRDRASFLGDLARGRAQLLSMGLWRRVGPDVSDSFDQASGLGEEPLAVARQGIEIIERWSRLRSKAGTGVVAIEGRLAGAVRRCVAALAG